MPIEWYRKFGNETNDYIEHVKITVGSVDELDLEFRAFMEWRMERPFTPDDIPFSEGGDDVPFDDEPPHPADTARARTNQRRAQATQQAAERKCGFCGGRTWNNIEKKKSGDFVSTAPDFTCRDKEKCGGVMWLLKDGSDGEWKEPRR